MDETIKVGGYRISNKLIADMQDVYQLLNKIDTYVDVGEVKDTKKNIAKAKKILKENFGLRSEV